jgi:two-component system cell cycle response regulator DivK
MARILLIEDNEMNRDMLARRLARRGYDVVIALDGETGIDLAVSGQPDLILMDMSLPGISGWDATIKLKAMENTRAIPIVALTAHALASDQARARQVGCDDYDTKPVDLVRLLEKIENLLSSCARA